VCADAKYVPLGRVSGVYGVKGWIKVHSFTEPRDNIVRFGEWVLGGEGASRRVAVEAGRCQGRSVVAKLDGVDDRNAAETLIGTTISIERTQLPPCAPGEYYWADLEGLAVHTLDGTPLGRIAHLVATGAHDVIVLDGDGSRLIPFVAGSVVRDVDLESGIVVVDWDASYWE
jgi:16S rRNA processing protein RimM